MHYFFYSAAKSTGFGLHQQISNFELLIFAFARLKQHSLIMVYEFHQNVEAYAIIID